MTASPPTEPRTDAITAMPTATTMPSCMTRELRPDSTSETRSCAIVWACSCADRRFRLVPTRLPAPKARSSGIDDDADFAALGMDDSLDRLQPVFAAFKRAFAGYGLDLDASFASLDARLLQQCR